MEHTKTIQGVYLPKEQLEAEMKASWNEFENSKDLSNPKHSFTKHINACFELFKQNIEQKEILVFNETSFYLPKEKVFGFVYRQIINQDTTNWHFTPSPLHQVFIKTAGDAYHDVKFNQKQVEGAMARIYPHLPVLRDEQQQRIRNYLCINRARPLLVSSYPAHLLYDPYYSNKTCCTYFGNGKTLYDYVWGSNSAWTLDLVPAAQSLKEAFAWFFTLLTLMPYDIQTLKAFPNLTQEQKQQFLTRGCQLEDMPADKQEEIATILEDSARAKEAEQALAQLIQQDYEALSQAVFAPLQQSPDYAIVSAFMPNPAKTDLDFILANPQALSAREDYFNNLTQADTERANIKAYDPKILTDANRGLWELWEDQGAQKGVFVPFKTPVVARNPKVDIKNGLVGIDFGTASTVVVYQEESASIHPMRVGLGNLSQRVDQKQYENPTIISFNNLTRFLESYKAQKGRPKTKWSDVNISHTAYSSMLGSPSSEYNSYLSELKQWAGNKHQKFQITDKQKTHFDLLGSLDLKEGDLNPIELYAYYLGLYINNQHHGIFLNYLLSFPVTYEVEVRKMILESFKRGLAKSLPNSLHTQGVVEQLKVEEGASEPAAYAIMALEGYGFEPSAEERVYYGVFDFGGGTTDFDFGLFQEAPESSRYDYILEHFGAGGDRYLGGENLLELASFEVFKRNKDVLLEKHIPFKKPAEGAPFPGSEILLSDSQEARINTKSLVEKLRPLWEGREFEEEDSLMLNLFNSHAEQIAGVSLDFNTQEVQKLFKERIKRGVENFFGEFVHATNAYFNSRGDSARDIDSFHIFLAGNASKSAFVTELFKEKITQIKAEMEQEGLQEIEFIVHQPLGGEELEKPNGKTGVAFGLIKARRGGSIQVIDYNVEENIKFKYFLGRSKKRKFYTLVARNQPYNQWVQFLDASESHFEVYYTGHASASTNTLSLEDSAIKKKALETGMVSDRAFIFVRLVSPSEFEFVVATQEGLESGEYLSEVVRVEL
ncbi:hypothetical protein [Helicobacter sp. L8]|uniref:hypothetical protein n=1 Tax=Helicobacter sp. L8 TaxID=2316078 RepID=UPI001F08C8F6|nr:hypothetical protein [Helicobacter sp. L8]